MQRGLSAIAELVSCGSHGEILTPGGGGARAMEEHGPQYLDATRFAYATETDEHVYSAARTTDWKQTSKSGVGVGGHQQSNGVTTFGTSNIAVQRTDWHAVVFEQLFLLSVFSLCVVLFLK